MFSGWLPAPGSGKPALNLCSSNVLLVGDVMLGVKEWVAPFPHSFCSPKIWSDSLGFDASPLQLRSMQYGDLLSTYYVWLSR